MRGEFISFGMVSGNGATALETGPSPSTFVGADCWVFATLLKGLVFGASGRERVLAFDRVPLLFAKFLLDLEGTDLCVPNNLLLLPRSCALEEIEATANIIKTVNVNAVPRIRPQTVKPSSGSRAEIQVPCHVWKSQRQPEM